MNNIPEKLYVGAQNGELYLIDRQPSPTPIDYPHEGYPTRVIARFMDNDDQALAIANRIAENWNTAAPTPPAQNTALPPAVLHALRFYANGEHFHVDPEAQEFDTVSGEPVNWLHSQKEDDCTMIEDGSIAKAVLQGKHIEADEDEPESEPIEGEIYTSAPPAQEDEPVGYRWRKKGQDESEWRIHGDLRGLDDEEICRNLDIEFVYTRPANDNLRKVAQEVWAYFHVADPIDCDEVENLMCKLRAALNRGES